MSGEITVVIPVGPEPHHKRFLTEALDSITRQTLKPQVLLVDDMADLKMPMFNVVKNYWRLGIPASFNVGIGAARTMCCLMMGADDTLEPECIEMLWDEYNSKAPEQRDYYCYWLDVKYMSSGEFQGLANNCMMVTKALWRQTGGFPPESAVGACDSIWHSMRLGNGEEFAGDCHVHNKYNHPMYNYRDHAASATASKSEPQWQTAIYAVRDVMTSNWKRPQWCRYD